MENDVRGCHRCHHELCVSRVPLFSTLATEELVKISSLIVQKSYNKGELIFLEGSKPEGLIVVNSGCVKTFRYTPDGREQILYIFSDGDFFGEMSLVRDQAATYSAEVLKDTKVCVIRKDDFRRLMREHPEILLKITEELSERLERMETMVQRMGSPDADARIITALLEFSRKYGTPHRDGRLITLPLSREGLANYIGVTRETVSRKLHHLQAKGLIKLIGTKNIVIVDEAALERMI